MHPTLFLSLALSPLLSITLAAPSGLNARQSCPSAPCETYNDLLQFCVDNYNENIASPGDYVGPTGIRCMCGHLGVEAYTDGSDTTQEGWVFVNTCYMCGDSTGDGLQLLTDWETVCNTWLNDGMDAAWECWNDDQDCDTDFKKLARM